MDRVSEEQRSLNMSHVRGKDTGIEIRVRRYLFGQGFRFRKNDKRYPGKPDIVLPKYHTVVFVHGCFWHRHANCKKASTPSTRTDFWEEKFRKNVENDARNVRLLEDAGWNVVVLWECEINKDFDATMEKLTTSILNR